MTADSNAPDLPGAPAARQVRAITYEHDGDRYEVSVGSLRKIYRRRTWPRGGYIKNADQQAWGAETGSTVTRIAIGDPQLRVVGAADARLANPPFVWRGEIRHIKYEDAPGRERIGVEATTPEAIARWMLGLLDQSKQLYQSDAVEEIGKRFGSEFTYLNENGNPAIDLRILRAFRKISGDAVVWDRWEFCWRRREVGDAPGRKQE